MKNILYLFLVALTAISCKKEVNYVTISGKILNPISDKISLHTMQDGNVIKEFKVDKSGVFSDTITLEKGHYFMYDGVTNIMVYLTPGEDLNMTFDTKQFDNTLKFDGSSKEINTYLFNKTSKQNKLFESIDEILNLKEDEFKTKLKSIENEYASELKKHNFDKDFVTADSTDTNGYLGYIEEMFIKELDFNKMTGQPSPVFENYENFNGGKTSLKDLKGKYVYIDVWATWCKPCLGEIPSMKELEKEFGQKMHFVSISVDDPQDKETWKKTVTEKEMKGIQLFANQSENSPFDTAYKINSIPRFILLDPQGNIVKANAMRPSNPKMKTLLNSLLKQ